MLSEVVKSLRNTVVDIMVKITGNNNNHCCSPILNILSFYFHSFLIFLLPFFPPAVFPTLADSALWHHFLQKMASCVFFFFFFLSVSMITFRNNFLVCIVTRARRLCGVLCLFVTKARGQMSHQSSCRFSLQTELRLCSYKSNKKPDCFC